MKYDLFLHVDGYARDLFIHCELKNTQLGTIMHWRKYIEWGNSEEEIEETLETLKSLIKDAVKVKSEFNDWDKDPTVADCVKIPNKFENRKQFIYDLDTSIEISELWLKRRKNAWETIKKMIETQE